MSEGYCEFLKGQYQSAESPCRCFLFFFSFYFTFHQTPNFFHMSPQCQYQHVIPENFPSGTTLTLLSKIKKAFLIRCITREFIYVAVNSVQFLSVGKSKTIVDSDLDLVTSCDVVATSKNNTV